MKRVTESSPKSKCDNISVTWIGYEKNLKPLTWRLFYVRGLRSYVSVSLTSMRRILSTNLLGSISLFGKDPVCFASATAGQQTTFTPNFCRRSTIDNRSMDLSDMRKKYKAQEEASIIQKTRVKVENTGFFHLMQCPVCVTARLWWENVLCSI